MFWYGNGMSGWGYALMTVGMVLFWGLVIVGAVALVRYAGRADREISTSPAREWPPEQVLANRFARGEIDDEEYRQRLDTLRGNKSRSTQA